jgi:tetratricopeptide (TPR) repeat protein
MNKCPIAAIAVAFALSLSAEPMSAQRFVDANADLRALQEDLAAQSNATLEAVRRQMSGELETVLRRLNTEITRRRRLRNERAIDARQRQIIEAEMGGLRRERDELIARLEKTDADYREAIGAFRQNIAGLLSNPSPEERAALNRYADGDASALDDIERISVAEAKTLQKAAASKLRSTAAMMLDAKERGEKPIVRAITAWERVSDADSSDAWASIVLTRLYLETGRLKEARAASERAVAMPASDRLRAIALTEAGLVLAETGELDPARRSLEESLDLFVTLSNANPSDPGMRRDVRVTRSRIGDLLQRAGRQTEAGALFSGLLKELEPLEAASPADAVVVEDLSIVRYHLAEINQKEGRLQVAAEYARADLASSQRLVKGNPTIRRRRDLAASFGRLGSVSKDGGDLQTARTALRSSMAISLDLMIGDKGETVARQVFEDAIQQLADILEKSADISGLHDISDALLRVGDTAVAGARAERTLTFAINAAEASPTDLEAQRLVAISLAKLGEVLAVDNRLEAARGQFEESLVIARRVAALYPARSPLAQYTLRAVLLSLGSVQRRLGDVDKARELFLESLEISDRLLAGDPKNPNGRGNVLAVRLRLAELPGGQSQWTEVLTLAEALYRDGQLSRSELEELRQRSKRPQ